MICEGNIRMYDQVSLQLFYYVLSALCSCQIQHFKLIHKWGVEIFEKLQWESCWIYFLKIKSNCVLILWKFNVLFYACSFRVELK
jgi:hypothetical protein